MDLQEAPQYNDLCSAEVILRGKIIGCIIALANVQLQDRVQMCKYGDDCTAFESIPIGELSNMKEVLDGLQNWATTNNMLLKPKKTKDMWISFSRNSIKPDALQINDLCLERV